MKLIEKSYSPLTDAVVELTGKDGNAFFILGRVSSVQFGRPVSHRMVDALVIARIALINS